MAFVTDTFDLRFRVDVNIGKPLIIRGAKSLMRIAVLIGAGLLAGTCLVAAVGTVEAVLPAFAPVTPVMRRLPGAFPSQLAVVDHQIERAHNVKRSWGEAYVTDAVHAGYQNADTDIIADIGAEGVMEAQPVTAMIIEPRAERVPFTPLTRSDNVAASVVELSDHEHGAFLALPDSNIIPVPELALDKTVAQTVPATDSDMFIPDDVPLPTRKPVIAQPSRRQSAAQLAYAPETGRTQEPKRNGLFSPLFNPAARGRAAIYDISAATVYLPSGEKLEAHSGIGGLRDNPRSVTQKNRGATPPHTYNLRMREALFHGVAAIRLTPVDGRNPHNRDGLLAHTYMLGRNGDSNGCVVFKDYARFLRAFQRGEFKQLVVVGSLPSQPSRVASLF